MVSHWLKTLRKISANYFIEKAVMGTKLVTWIKSFLAFRTNLASALEPLLSLTIHELACAISRVKGQPDLLGPSLC
jgi:hypothetical protein